MKDVDSPAYQLSLLLAISDNLNQWDYSALEQTLYDAFNEVSEYNLVTYGESVVKGS